MPALPILAALLLYLLRRSSRSALDAFVESAVLWGVLVLLLTEVLSTLRMVTLVGVTAAWGVITLALAATLWRSRGAPRVRDDAAEVPLWAAIPTLVTLVVTLIVTLVAPPNSTDALTYHLARVAHWMQHHSVAAYATSVTHQIFMPPWSEYTIMHLQVLAGGSDRFASLVQWLAFLGCLILGYGLARRLGADSRGAGTTVVLIATLPTAIIEASSTQNDLVTAFWSAAFAWFCLDDRRVGQMRETLLAGSALGLAIASKGTAYTICAPFVGWWLLRRMRSFRVHKLMLHAGILACTVLLLNLRLYTQNIRLFHDALGPSAMRAALGNASHGFGSLASNIVRNATVHLRTPKTSWNNRIAHSVERLHSWAGLDVQDPATTFPGDTFHVPLMSTYEGRVGNVLHFVIYVLAAGLLWVRPRRTLLHQYSIATFAGALLFCWTFRWQHWHGRLHTPFFILAAPLVATTLQSLLIGRRAAALTVILWLASLPWLLANNMRPLLSIPKTRLTFAAGSIFRVPREDQYFGQATARLYWRVVDDLAQSGCSEVGLVGDENTRVYPLVPFARARGLDLRLYYVFLKNETRELETHPPLCALFVAEEQPAGWQPGFPYQRFELRWSAGKFAVWAPPGRGRER
jgi:hypothetical protein